MALLNIRFATRVRASGRVRAVALVAAFVAALVVSLAVTVAGWPAHAHVLVELFVLVGAFWLGRRESLVRAWRAARRAKADARESASRYRALFERNGAVQLVLDHTSGEIVDANPAAERFYGMSRAELTRRSIVSINDMTPEELRAVGDAIGSGERVHFTRRHRVAGGEQRDVEVFTGPVTIAGRRLLHSIVHDVSDRVRAERSMRESEARYRLLFAANPRPTWVYDRETLRFLAVNPAASAQYGYSEAEFLTMTLGDIRPADERGSLRARVDRAGASDIPTSQSRHLTRDGREIDVELASHPLEYAGRPARLVVMEDVTERRRLEATLANLAVRDDLTGLLNRRGFQQMAEHELTVAARSDRRDAVLYLDLDGLKPINDTYGHAAGDAALRATADLLRAAVRDGDLVARLGGDELVVYAIGLTAPDEVASLVARLAEVLDAHNDRAARAGRRYRIAFSVGVAERQPADSLDDLLARADASLYVAKQARRAAAAL